MNYGLVVKKILIVFGFFILAFSLMINPVLASEEEVKEGQGIWQKLSASELQCENLTDEQFENLGEFFMERMAGFSSDHEIMDKQMEQMVGKEGLERMHIMMGKRMSGCQPGDSMGGGMMGSSTGSASSLQAGSGLGMMMKMMMGSPSGQTWKGGERPMMGPGMMGWYGGNSAGWGMMGQGGFWIWMILGWITWILIIVALVAFIRWMWKKGEK